VREGGVGREGKGEGNNRNDGLFLIEITEMTDYFLEK
jgi:hypothetical protein